MQEKFETLSMEHARLIYRNFSGKRSDYNPEGDRNFCILLPDEDAKKLKDLGWNVKWSKPKNEEDAPFPYIKVKVSYAKIPPIIVQITSKNKVKLQEKDITLLDYATITNADLILAPSHWEKAGKSGISIYLRKGYFTLEEDEFEAKYADVPEASANDSPPWD